MLTFVFQQKTKTCAQVIHIFLAANRFSRFTHWRQRTHVTLSLFGPGLYPVIQLGNSAWACTVGVHRFANHQHHQDFQQGKPPLPDPLHHWCARSR